MRISLEFDGMKELLKQMERLADDTEIRKTNREIYQQCADVTQPRMQAHMPRSANNAKSGKKGYRPPGHAKDNVPKKVTAKQAEVGWSLLGDAEYWFYMKFVEWGTTKQTPQDFIYNTLEECDGEYSRIAEKEYQALLNSKIGG